MTATTLTPPQAPPSWTHTPEELTRVAKEAVNKDRKVKDRVAALKESECNFETVFRALALAEAEFETTVETLSFYQNVSPSQELRDASNDADSLMRDYVIECSMRLDVFEAKQAATRNIEASGRKLTPEEQRLVEKMIQDGRRAGLALPEEKRKELTVLKKELSNACLEFTKNVNEEKSTIAFTAEELKGVPKNVIDGLKKCEEDGKEIYEVSYKGPDISAINGYAEDPDVRKRAMQSAALRLHHNVPVLDRILDLRRRIAALLDYPTWADYAIENRMAKNAKNVIDFLSDLEQKLRPVALKEREVLLALKQEEYESKGLHFDGKLYRWDQGYYQDKYVKKALNLDPTLVKEHFTADVVVPTVLEIYHDLLGVQFVEVEGTLWHSDAQQYAVWEKDTKDESGFLGYCYLDLYTRESKYPHVSVWCPSPGYTRADGTQSYPVAAMVANIAKPTPGKPALMRHHDVVMFFHEMGHVFHTLLSKTKFSRFHGTAGPIDFAEAPSQMLENWCWEPKVLEKMMIHYETKEPAPRELIDKLVRTRYSNVGLFYLDQLFLATYDMKVHVSTEYVDHTKLWNELRESMTSIKSGDLTTPGQTSFAHLVSSGGYDAGYYSYTWSLVFAADMYATIFKADPLDPERGQRYREMILQPGTSRDEMELLEDFLGRPPNSEAFMKLIFGDSA